MSERKKLEAGNRFTDESGTEFEVHALGEVRTELIGWTECVIYRPVLSGSEIAEAAAEGNTTWYVLLEDEFLDEMTAIN